VVDAFVSSLDGDTRRVSGSEWGISLEAGGWPLHVGLAFRDGLFRTQAEVVGPGVLDPDLLLFWNRQLPFVCFAQTGAGDVYVKGEVPNAAVDAAYLDQLFGVVLEAADSPFNDLLVLGFLTSMKKEWAWRVSRGESTRNLDAFRHLLDGSKPTETAQ